MRCRSSPIATWSGFARGGRDHGRRLADCRDGDDGCVASFPDDPQAGRKRHRILCALRADAVGTRQHRAGTTRWRKQVSDDDGAGDGFAWPDLEIERGVIEAAGFKLVSGPAEALPADKIAVLAAQHGPDAIMTCWAEVNAAAIDACPRVSAIVARIGVGLDNIDRVAADRRGAVVTNVPDYCVEEVSDHAVGFLLAFARGLVTFDREVKQGRVGAGHCAADARTRMTVGIAGYGRIGRRTAEKLAAFGVNLLVNGRRSAGQAHAGHRIRRA